MAASHPLINSPHSGLGRHPDMAYMARPKRSDSAQFESAGPRGLFDTAARMHEISEEPTFIPTSLGEHLLERTYLDDVVRPLVRALVKARMTYGVNGEGPAENSQAYVDLEKLRRELERSTQRARHAEQERDDLARRLDLAGLPDVSRDRAERHPDHLGPNDHASSPSRAQQQQQQPPPPSMMGYKRPRPSEADSIRGNHNQRSAAPGSNAVSVNVAHGDGPGASITVTTEGPAGAPINMVSRPHHGPSVAAEQMSPPMSYAPHPGAGRHRPYPDLHHDPHDERAHLARMPLSEADYSYSDERADRYGMPSVPAAHRPPLSRFGGMGDPRSPPGSSSYLTSGSERSSMPTLTTYPSTSSSSSFSATPYSSLHPYDHEMEEMERSRKIPRLRPSEPPSSLDPHQHSLMAGNPNRPPNNYMITPSASSTSDANYPVRKLASTKNRTCSNCAAPHDAKFRRGPNGPGTLCDRCGSRWKKFKEQESASKREHELSSANNNGNSNSNSASASAPASAAAANAAHARLSSASASSQSPMEPPGAVTTESGRVSESSLPPMGGGGSGSEANGRGLTGISPRDANGESNNSIAHQRGGGGERERSASVDQLIDD
ncbi:uncharacterized protein UTRI_05946 [Ustilago trichophora]|uniref:GATA-type domain-containing protein n=1 Tax=Ustilago trichophora TaxID=86804 RepID=A0A5C3EK58_9BASI|nr:uncharacterized protein UTRI_05946 [Ustilago trichophora]